MPQMIYSVAAILLLGVSFFHVNQKVHGTDNRLLFSELTTEMTSVGAEILDEMGKRPFDANTVSGLMIPVADLSASPRPAVSTCDPDDPDYQGCATIGHFHGKTATRNRPRVHSGTTYNVPYNVTSIEVEYVTEAPPHTVTTSRTFAKEATIRVSTPALVDGSGDPYEIEMKRVYMYPDL